MSTFGKLWCRSFFTLWSEQIAPVSAQFPIGSNANLSTPGTCVRQGSGRLRVRPLFVLCPLICTSTKWFVYTEGVLSQSDLVRVNQSILWPSSSSKNKEASSWCSVMPPPKQMWNCDVIKAEGFPRSADSESSGIWGWISMMFVLVELCARSSSCWNRS